MLLSSYTYRYLGIMIKFDKVSFEYIAEKPILADFSFSFTSNHVTSILGPSGSGKTTIINLICGLLNCTKGKVIVGDTAEDNLGKVNGVLFQDDTLIPWLTLLENAVFPLRAKEGTNVTQNAIMELGRVGLAGELKKLPQELSAGMKKRLEFIRAIISDQKFLLADEPFSGLDFAQRRKLWQIWLDHFENHPRTSILVTHDLDEALAVSDEIIVLSHSWPLRVVYHAHNSHKGWFSDCDAQIFSSKQYLDLRASLMSGQAEQGYA